MSFKFSKTSFWLFVIISFALSNSKEVFITEDLVPGCLAFKTEGDNSSGISLTCLKFDTNSTPALMPKNTRHLEVYGVKNLPTNQPLLPESPMLSKLELTSNSLHNVSKTMLEGLHNLIYISFKDNLIKLVPPDLFANNLNLEVVDLSANFILTIESVTISVKNLVNLKSLRLSDNKLLRYITDYDFIPLKNSSLKTLDVESCDIRYTESKAFQPLKLVSLNISNNPLSETALLNVSQSLDKDSIKDLSVKETNMPYFSCRFLQWLRSTQLETLDLTENEFVCFPHGYYPSLKSLIIDNSKISFSDEDSFKGMPKLEFLSMRGHKLNAIDKEFKANVELKFLDLSDFYGYKTYSFFNIADYAFENQGKLLELRISNVPIRKNIRQFMLYGLKTIQFLDLSSCLIRSIDCFAFESLNNLRTLKLSSNFITSLSNCSFYGLRNLKLINLSYNLLTFIDVTYPFEHMSNLESIILNSNSITELPAYAFSHLQNLTFISLSKNIIRPWNHEFLPKGSNFTTLIVSENDITHFTQQMFNDIFRMHFFEFLGNPINCSHCSVMELQEWMKNQTSVHYLYNRTNKYTCHAPDSMAGTDILKANITSATHHCFLVEKDMIVPISVTLSFITFLAIMSVFIWYRWSWTIRYYTFLIQSKSKRNKIPKESGDYPFDAYVSYCENDDQWVVNHLVPILEHDNPKFRLCLPDRDFDAGLPILQNINSAINKSRSSIIVVSEAYLDSRWCLHNIKMAENLLFEKSRSGMIIVFLENIAKDKLGKDLQYVLKTRTCIWWTKDPVGQKLFWERLRLAVMRPSDKGISKHVT